MTPIDALRLAEDIQTLELAMELLTRIDPASIDLDRNEARLTLRRVDQILIACRNYASDTLRWNYLAGTVLPRRTKTQTLADIWEIMKVDLQSRRKLAQHKG